VLAATLVVQTIWVEVVADTACTFAMSRGDGAGVPAPLTRPAQPLSTTGASVTTKGSSVCRNQPLILLMDS
jgi:hypothetical protein